MECQGVLVEMDIRILIRGTRPRIISAGDPQSKLRSVGEIVIGHELA
jgi:hypothetical protein